MTENYLEFITRVSGGEFKPTQAAAHYLAQCGNHTFDNGEEEEDDLPRSKEFAQLSTLHNATQTLLNRARESYQKVDNKLGTIDITRTDDDEVAEQADMKRRAWRAEPIDAIRKLSEEAEMIDELFSEIAESENAFQYVYDRAKNGTQNIGKLKIAQGISTAFTADFDQDLTVLSDKLDQHAEQLSGILTHYADRFDIEKIAVGEQSLPAYTPEQLRFRDSELKEAREYLESAVALASITAKFAKNVDITIGEPIEIGRG